MKRTLLPLLSLSISLSARASGVAALGDIACGIYTNTATTGIPCVANEWLDGVLNVGEGSYTPDWWTDYGVTNPNASPAPDAAATTGQLKWCVRQTAALLDNVATNVGGAGSWLFWTAANLPPDDNDVAVTVAEFAALVEPVVDRVQQLEIDSMYTSADGSSISNLFDYGSYSNEPVSLAHLKNVFNFDPEIDSYADGIPDWWQRYYGLISWGDYGEGDPNADFDWDGLADYAEWLAGSDPTDRDTDGDGLVDGVDPDPNEPDPGTDANHNGIPDSFEVFWFGSTSATPYPTYRDDAGFTLLDRMAAGLCPTNTSPEPSAYPLDGLRATPLVPRFGADAVTNAIVWQRSFAIDRHGAWEQYFVSSAPDPVSPPYESVYGDWALDGLVLEWEDSAGGFGSAAFSPEWTTYRIPVSTNDPATLTLRLRATRTGLARCPAPLLLLEYAPTVSFPGLPSSQQDDVRLVASPRGEDVPFRIDRSGRPSSSELSSDEEDSLVFLLPRGASYSRTSPDGATLAQGTLSFRFPGVVSIPQIAPGAAPALRSGPRPPRELLLAILDPELRFGYGHAWLGWDVGWDWTEGRYVRRSPYPLDSACLWRSFQCDDTGRYVCNCEPELLTGTPPEYEEWFDPVLDVNWQTEVATGRIFLGGSLVWSNSVAHSRWYPDWEDLSDDCGCESACATCEDAEGPSHSSLAFRIPLGQPREGQLSGFLWFRTEGPISISPDVFEVLARADATVSDTTDGTNRTVVCAGGRGRTVLLEPITNGVRATVRLTATGSLEHTWEIANENGSPSRVRLRRISRKNAVMSDALYVHDGSDWNVVDPVANTLSSLRTTDLLDDPEDPTFTEERVLADASDASRVYSHTISVSRRFGEGDSAVLREVERREDVGTPYEKTATASYWEDGGGRAGLPRLVAGDARPWSWTDYDDRGRSVLAFEQRDGSETPWDGTGWSLSSPPAPSAFATASDYTPLPGDSNHRDDIPAVRTQSRYAIDGYSPILIARTWFVYVRGTNAGLPSVTVRTERAASQSAQFGDPSNAVSVAVSVDPDAEGVPLLLRGRPLSYTGEDGVTTTYSYDLGAWNASTRTFAAGSGASHLRTRVLATTPEAPNGVPLVSTVSETVEDAVHGDELWSATRVLLANGSLSDPFDWEARVYDDQDRLRSTLYSDGSASTNAYSCCRLLFTIDRNGLKRERLAETGSDHLRYAWLDNPFADLPKNKWIPLEYNYTTPGAYINERTFSFRAVESLFDPLGREIRRRILSTEPNRSKSIGSLRRSNDAWESVETNIYPFGSSDYRIHVDARGLRTVTDVYRDESANETWTESFSGTNLLERVITLSVRGGGTETAREWDDEWTRSLSFSRYGADGCRTDYTVSMASDAPVVTNSVAVSDFLGRTARVVTPLSDSAYAYDGASSRVLSVSDAVSGLSTATLYDARREPVGSVSAGVSSLSATRYELSSGDWWRVTETREAAGAQTNLLSTVRERLTGLSNARRSEVVSIPADGPTTTTLVSFDPATSVSTETNLVDGLAPRVVRSMFGRVFETEDRDGTIHRSFFDTYGRPYLTGDLLPDGSFVWRTWTLRNALGDVTDEIELTLGSLPAIGLAQGHSSAIVTYPNNDNNQTKWRGLWTQYAYDVRGNLIASWDKEGYGRFYERDSIGRIVGTYGAEYPSARLLDTAGRLVGLETIRAGASWDRTSWDYDAATGLCTNKTYADGTTMAHTFTADGLPLRTTLASGAWTQNAYDASRRLASVSTSDGEGDHALSYDAFGRVTDAVGPDTQYHYVRDALGRVTCESRDDAFANPFSSISRSFDECGRPAGYALEFAPDFPDDFRQSVCYDWGMDGNLAGMTLSNAQGRAVDFVFSWEQGRFAGCEALDEFGGSIFYRANVRARRRPRLVTSCAAGNDFGDVRSFSYAYDAVGRPVERDFDSFAYDARGQVTNAAIDGASYRYAYDHIGNRTSANEDGTATSYTANNVNQYTAVGSAEPEYDEDGNLVDDGTRTFSWSAAGRLTEASVGDVRVRSVYDWRGRRIERYVERLVGWWYELVEMRQFVYDDWNLVHEYRYDAVTWEETEIEYFWGPDLSGTLQGAGGVGGLVAVSVDGDYYFPGYDNNGNVIGYWNEDGDLVAEYAYDAFGNTIYEDGDLADFFPHRFSTKYYDSETDLYYYGYRYYSPSLGRWISRDPIEEEGGNNLYGFLANSCLCCLDPFGLKTYLIHSIGDSMTYGVRTRNSRLMFNKGRENSMDNAKLVPLRDNQGWRGFLKEKLDGWSHANRALDIKFEFVGNHAESTIPGNVPHDGYPGVKASEYMNKYKPNLCGGGIYIVFLGMNDANAIGAKNPSSWNNLMSDTKEGFERILNAINDNSPELLLLGKPPLMTTMVEPERREKVNAVLQQHIYPFIDSLYDSWSPKYNKTGDVRIFQQLHTVETVDDGFHYSIEGNRLIADKLFKEITDFVRGIPEF